jgi:hypothetical protein
MVHRINACSSVTRSKLFGFDLQSSGYLLLLYIIIPRDQHK